MQINVYASCYNPFAETLTKKGKGITTARKVWRGNVGVMLFIWCLLVCFSFFQHSYAFDTMKRIDKYRNSCRSRHGNGHIPINCLFSVNEAKVDSVMEQNPYSSKIKQLKLKLAEAGNLLPLIITRIVHHSPFYYKRSSRFNCIRFIKYAVLWWCNTNCLDSYIRKICF